MPFASLDDIRAFCRDQPDGNRRFADIAAQRQQNLTKPPGSLGRLEELAVWLAQWQAREKPRLERVTIAVFAGNHGIAARGVSAYPQAVTAQMVEHIGADYFIWASDYPHIDASFGVVRELKEHLAPLSEDARRKVLGLNAQRFYRLAG